MKVVGLSTLTLSADANTFQEFSMPDNFDDAHIFLCGKGFDEEVTTYAPNGATALFPIRRIGPCTLLPYRNYRDRTHGHLL